MHRFIEGEDRMQPALLPHCLEDYVDEENPVRVIEVFIDELDLAALGFSGMTPAATGRPAYHPGFPRWIGWTGPKAAETLAKLLIPSFTRRVRQDSVTCSRIRT